MKKEPVLLVMAAGMGSRYGGLKQIDKITDEGDIILDFSLYDAKRAGFKKAVFIVRKEISDDIKAIIDRGAGVNMDIEYVMQELDNIPEGYKVPEDRKKPWGTGHAILSAYDVIDGPFAVINADDYYGVTAFKEMYKFLNETEDESKFAMVAYDLENTVTEHGSVSRGICQVEKGFLSDIVERTAITKRRVNDTEEIGFEEKGAWHKLERNTPVSMNFWGYSKLMMEKLQKDFPEFLKVALKDNPQKCEFLIPTVTNDCIKSGEADCKVLESHDKWYGVTYKEDKDSVKEALSKLKKEGVYPQKLWK